MKREQIVIGNIYPAKVNGRVVPVRVLSIEPRVRGYRYRVMNTLTQRETSFRSASKFRASVRAEPVKVKPVTLGAATLDDREIEAAELLTPEQRYEIGQMSADAIHQTLSSLAAQQEQ